MGHAFMHIPVQSGSDNVLRSMRREYTDAEFSYVADKLRAAIPEIFLLTDIICGFPAESRRLGGPDGACEEIQIPGNSHITILCQTWHTGCSNEAVEIICGEE